MPDSLPTAASFLVKTAALTGGLALGVRLPDFCAGGHLDTAEDRSSRIGS